MYIALVPDIKYYPVTRSVHRTVQSKCKFHYPKVRGKVSARSADIINKESPYLGGKRIKLFIA